MKTPDYVLTEDVVHSSGPYDTKTLPTGAFVRPIELCYVPKHITEHNDNRMFKAEFQAYCYTRFGIIAISWSKMRRV